MHYGTEMVMEYTEMDAGFALKVNFWTKELNENVELLSLLQSPQETLYFKVKIVQ